ncbi:MAG: WbqC family protein [Elusimicrobiota bacterium]|nr:WbqC family protein [Elusimicrobiota bacterium]
MNYSKAKYFNQYKIQFSQIYHQKWQKLIYLNLAIIKLLLECFKINTKTVFSSELNLSTSKTERIIDICKRFNADTYLSGAGGKDYLDEKLFQQNNIKLVYQDFKHPVYEQVYSGFELNLSAIDLLFNCGSDSIKKLSG